MVGRIYTDGLSATVCATNLIIHFGLNAPGEALRRVDACRKEHDVDGIKLLSAVTSETEAAVAASCRRLDNQRAIQISQTMRHRAD